MGFTRLPLFGPLSFIMHKSFYKEESSESKIPGKKIISLFGTKILFERSWNFKSLCTPNRGQSCPILWLSKYTDTCGQVYFYKLTRAISSSNKSCIGWIKYCKKTLVNWVNFLSLEVHQLLTFLKTIILHQSGWNKTVIKQYTFMQMVCGKTSVINLIRKSNIQIWP